MAGTNRPPALMVAAIGSIAMGVICCGWGGISLVGTALSDTQVKMFAQMEAQEKERVATRRQDLVAQRDAATDPQARATLDQEIAALDAQKMPDMSAMMAKLQSPAVRSCYIFEGASAFVFNVMMLISGCGLLALKSWARILGILGAAGRLLTSVVYLILTFTVVMPAMSDFYNQMMAEMAKSSGPGGPPAMPQMGTFMTTIGSASAVVMFLMVCAWPAALLCLLLSRKVREALSPATAPAPSAST